MKISRGIPVPYLSTWRIWAGLSREELAKASGLYPGTIHNIELGEPALFTSIGKLAQALGLSRQQLLHSLPESEQVRA